MITIGLILWFIIIAFITFSDTPDFIWVLLISILIFFAIYAIATYIGDKISDMISSREEKKRSNKFTSIDSEEIKREIEAWEKKWKRPHPSKTIGNQRKNH